jgi:hypothetical protein
MRLRNLFLVAGCAILLCGCTKSNIVTPEEGKLKNAEPDTSANFLIELDMAQLQEDVQECALDEIDYPMADSVSFELNLDEAYLDVTVTVKDDTDPEEIGWYAGEVLKVINDSVATQDFTYGLSSDTTFGGLYQDNVTNLKVYYHSDYPDGEPIIDTQIPEDTYVEFEME